MGKGGRDTGEDRGLLGRISETSGRMIRIAGRILKRIRDCWKDTEEDKGLLEVY